MSIDKKDKMPPDEIFNCLQNDDVKKWNEWHDEQLKIVSTGSSVAEIRDMNLSNLNLAGIHFRRVYFKNCRFRNTNLSHSDFTDSRVSSSDVRSANLQNSNLSGADFNSCDLCYANLSYSYVGDSLSGSTINSGTILDGIIIDVFGLYSLNISDNTQLVYGLAKQICELNAEDNEIQKIQEKLQPFAEQFYGEIETAAEHKFDDKIEIISPPREMFQALKYGDVEKWNSWHDDLESANKSFKIELSGMKLNNVNLQTINLSNSLLKNSEILNSDLSHKQVNNENRWYYEKSSFKNSDLENSVINNTNLYDCDFRNSNLKNCNLSGSKIVHSKFAGANLKDAVIDWTTDFDPWGFDVSLFGVSGLRITNNTLIVFGLIRQLCLLISEDTEIITLQKKLVSYANRFYDVLKEKNCYCTERRIDEVKYKTHYEIGFVKND